MPPKKKKHDCSFCGKTEEEVVKLISNRDDKSFICDECVSVCGALLKVNKAKSKPASKIKPEIDIKTPQEMYDHLNNYVIGQERAKKYLCSAVYNHYKRVKNNMDDIDKDDGIELEKSNVMMIGPSGSGKTLLIKIMAKHLGVPFAQADATSLTQAGYVGEDVENMVSRLFQTAKGDSEEEKVANAEMGIVFIDEIDKTGRKGENPSITRDVSGEGVQQSLLKLLEGTVCNIAPDNRGGGRRHPQQQTVAIDTSNVLFVVGGAFEGLNEIVKKRVGSDGMSIGFSGGEKISKKRKINDDEYLSKTIVEDVIKYGMIPELMGRIPVVTTLAELSKDELKSVLLEPKNAISKQYKKLFKMDKKELILKDEAIDFLVNEAHSMKIGARALRSVMEHALNQSMFDAPTMKASKIVVDKAFLEAKFPKENLAA